MREYAAEKTVLDATLPEWFVMNDDSRLFIKSFRDSGQAASLLLFVFGGATRSERD